MCSSRRIRAAREYAAEHSVRAHVKPRVVSYRESDQRMAFAIEEAKRTLRQFFDAWASPKTNQTAFLLKVLFEADGEHEHVWVADVDASVMPLQGTIANEPELPGLRFMDRVSFQPDRITDWMYVEDGYLVGGFTTQVIRAALSPKERVEHDKHAPYRFREP